MTNISESFRFFSLPLEVRCKVYGCLFTPATVSVITENFKSSVTDTESESWSLVDDYARTGQLLSTSCRIFYEARPIFFRDLTLHVERDGLIPQHWTNDQQDYSSAKHVRNMCIDISACDLHNFRNNIRDYEVIKGSLTRIELKCAAPEWRGPLLSIDWGGLEARPSFEDALEVMSTIAMLFMLRSKLNKMTNMSIKGRKVHFVLEQSSDVKRGQKVLCDNIGQT